MDKLKMHTPDLTQDNIANSAWRTWMPRASPNIDSASSWCGKTMPGWA
ncbi:MAG TPA: hypothetical protein VK465_12010 [Fibrobacteria bacterium]|nr:hypothetical protein [Fibrobacteria bacterium]